MKDKDYNPNSVDYNSDSSNDCDETRSISIIVNAEIHHNGLQTSGDAGGGNDNTTGCFNAGSDVMEIIEMIEIERMETQIQIDETDKTLRKRGDAEIEK